MKQVDVNGELYDVYPQEAVAASKVVADMHERLGRPDDPFTETGSKMVEIIVSVWMDCYPREYHEWKERRREHLKAEMSIQEQVSKKTGRSLASIPMPVHKMMKKVFPRYENFTRDDYLKFIKKYPIFSMVNKV